MKALFTVVYLLCAPTGVTKDGLTAGDIWFCQKKEFASARDCMDAIAAGHADEKAGCTMVMRP